jgi:hypothetical protein
LELLDESNIGAANDRQWLLRGSAELVAIFPRIGKTAKSKHGKLPIEGIQKEKNSRPAVAMKS